MTDDELIEELRAHGEIRQERDLLEEIHQRDTHSIKVLRFDNDRLRENYLVLTRRFDLLEAELARERARMTRHAEALKTYIDHEIASNGSTLYLERLIATMAAIEESAA